MSTKMRAMVEIEVTLTDAEWRDMQTDYEENWREEIKAGDAEKKMLTGDAWNAIVADGEPNDFEINWDAFTDEEILDDE